MINAIRSLAALVAATAAFGAAQAVVVTESFDGAGTPAGWVIVNNSTAGGTTSWFKGNPGVLPAQSGDVDSYFAANYLAAPDNGAANNISDWFISPVYTFGSGATVSFWTISNGLLSDRMQVRFSSAGSSTNVGATTTSVGDFTTLLTDINPAQAAGGYPTAWTQFTLSIPGLAVATSGRLAFRYLVTDNSSNGDYVGIDTLAIDTGISAVPEPDSPLIVALGFAILALAMRGRGRRAARA